MGVIVFVAGVARAFIAADRERRGKFRLLASAVRPSFRGTWSGGLDDLRARLEQALNSAPFPEPKLRLDADVEPPPGVRLLLNLRDRGSSQIVGGFVIRFGRDGKKGYHLLLTSSHPFRRASKAHCTQVADVIEQELAKLTNVERS